MKRAFAVSAALAAYVCLSMITATEARCGMNPGVKIAVHVLPHADRSCSKGLPAISGCGEIITTYAGCGDIDFFPVFFGLTGYRAVQYGMTWPGSGSCAFTPCSELEIGSIVWSGDGIAQSWTECHLDFAVIPGWGWVTCNETGTICMTEHPTMYNIEIADCEFQSDFVAEPFCAGVCGADGMDPCAEPPPLEPLGVGIHDNLQAGCVFADDDITYTISYDNAVNPGTAHGVKVFCLCSPSTDFQYASDGGRRVSGNLVEWDLGMLLVGESGTVELGVRVNADTPQGTDLAAIARITCDQAPDSVAAETTAVCVETLAPLGLSKDDGLNGGNALVGDLIEYTISFDNYANPAPVHNVLLTDDLTSKFNFVSASDGGAYDSGTRSVTWDIGTLYGGVAGEVQLTVEVGYNVGDGADILNTCSIRGEETRITRAEERTEALLPKVAIHVLPHKFWRSCTADFPIIEHCSELRVETDSCDVDIYPVFFDFGEFRELEYSLVWPEEWGSMAFMSCSDLTDGGIVHPWDGVIQSWESCQPGGIAIPAVCHLTATYPDQIAVEVNPNTGFLGVTTCRGNKYHVTMSFAGGICGAPGEHPCGGGPTRAVPTTWGAIKSMFK